jgi:hypothetical protein
VGPGAYFAPTYIIGFVGCRLTNLCRRISGYPHPAFQVSIDAVDIPEVSQIIDAAQA